MATLTKPLGSSCPTCGKQPAEFQSMGGPKRWQCHHCGAEGLIASGQAEKPATKGPTVHPHWTTRNAFPAPAPEATRVPSSTAGAASGPPA